MSWTRLYRLALHLLPAALRNKQASAMEGLFARELERARARGWLYGALAGAAGIWDGVRRAAYELVRPRRGPADGRDSSPTAPQPTTAEILRRHAASFVIAFVALTASLVVLFAMKQVPALSARGASASTIPWVLVLAVPFTAAMAIPMAMFVAVLREFARLGANGTLTSARRQIGGIRRLVVPVLAFAAVIAGLALVEIAVVIPPANTKLATIMMGRGAAPNGRTMTLGELREAERNARSSINPIDTRAAAVYEVEIQKKFALPAACLVLALTGVALALRVPRGGGGLVLGASCVVFTAYYLLIITGENLALRLIVSPVIGMWGANVLLAALALLTLWRPRAPGASSDSGAVVIQG
jgi:lipopolysaccharide export LptBFGC system permease protein LptF